MAGNDNNSTDFSSWQEMALEEVDADACGNVYEPEPVDCELCIPNENAMVPNWITRKENEPFKNERTCEYWITMRHANDDNGDPVYYTSTGGSELGARMQQYVEPAARKLLSHYGKLENDETVELVMSAIQPIDYHVSERPYVKMRVLCAIPVLTLDQIEAAPIPAGSAFSGATYVSIDMRGWAIETTIRKVRHSLKVFSKFQGIKYQTELAYLYFEDTGILLNLSDERDNLKEFLPALKDWLELKGWSARLSMFTTSKEANTVAIGFSDAFEVEEITVTPAGCEPTTYDVSQLESLRETFPFNHPTTMALVADIYTIEAELEAREGPPNFIDFATQHIYPPVAINYGSGDGTLYEGEDALSCLAESIDGGFAQEFLGELYSIGDALAYIWDQSLCHDPDDIEEQIQKMKDAAKEAKDELNASKTDFWKRLLEKYSSDLDEFTELDDLFTNFFSKIKWCGLFSLASEAMECLLSGLDWDEAVEAICRAALKGMNVDAVGMLYDKLEIDVANKVLEKVIYHMYLKHGYEEDEAAQLAEAEWSTWVPGEELVHPDKETQEPIKFNFPWEDSGEAKASETENPAAANTAPSTSSSTYPDGGAPGSIGGQAKDAIEVILSAFVEAILEVYATEGFDLLLDVLNKLPGAELIANMIALLSCPVPPPFDPPLLDFMKGFEVGWCNGQWEMTLPRQVSPLINFGKIRDIFGHIFKLALATLEALVMQLLKMLVEKVLNLLMSALCAALELAGKLAGEVLGDLLTGTPLNWEDIMRDAFCGADATSEEIATATEQLLAGLQVSDLSEAEQMANQENIQAMMVNLSSTLTNQEFVDLITGDASPTALALVEEVVATESPEFATALGNKAQIKSAFANVGAMMPKAFKDEFKQKYSESITDAPSSPSLCASAEDLEEWRSNREALLKNNAMLANDTITDEQIQEQFDKVRAKALQDFEELGTILSKGGAAFLMDNLPPLMDTPGETGDPACVPVEPLLPTVPAELNTIMEGINNKIFDSLWQAHTDDLIGQKSIFGADEGFISMLLSDTNGVPYNKHKERVGNMWSKRYVDYQGQKEVLWSPGTVNYWLAGEEEGFFPEHVSDWLQFQLADVYSAGSSGDLYATTMEYVDSVTIPAQYLTYDKYTKEIISEWTFPGDKEPDLVLNFRDNNANHPSADFNYGFDLEFSNFVMTVEPTVGAPQIGVDDTYHLKIIDVFNLNSDRSDKEYEVDGNNITPVETPSATGAPNIQETEVLEIHGSASMDNDVFDAKSKFSIDVYGTESPQAQIYKQFIADKWRLIGADDSMVESIQSQIGSSIYDLTMNRFFSDFSKAIADNKEAFSYGYDSSGAHSKKDFLYWEGDIKPSSSPLQARDGGDGWRDWLYASNVTIESEAEGFKEVWDSLDKNLSDFSARRKAMKARKKGNVFGTSAKVSYDAAKDEMTILEVPHPNIYFLDPEKYGGRVTNPPMYVEPVTGSGWIGIAEALVPEYDGCEPRRQDLIGFNDIKELYQDVFDNVADDERLKYDEDCVQELPYARIFDRSGAAGTESSVMATIRIYVAEEMLKSMPTFTKFRANIPEVYDSLYLDYIIALIEEGIKDGGRKIGVFSDEGYWWAFLEQCVQIYGRRVEKGKITPDAPEQAALDALNEFQEGYHYPTKDDVNAAASDDEIVMGNKVSWLTPLKTYRRWKNEEAIKNTSSHAKVLMRALVKDQVNSLSERMYESLSKVDMQPLISDLGKWFIGTSGFVHGSSLEVDLPSGELPSVRSENFPGDVLNAPSLGDYGPEMEYDNIKDKLTTGFFILEKYVRVEDKHELGLTDVILPEIVTERGDHLRGVVSFRDWSNYIILLKDVYGYGDKQLSDFFGDLSLVYATGETGEETSVPIGVEGTMGISYGLRLSYVMPISFNPGNLTGEMKDLAEKRKSYYFSDPGFGTATPDLNSAETQAIDGDPDVNAQLIATMGGDEMSPEDALNNWLNQGGPLYITPLASAEKEVIDNTIGEYRDVVPLPDFDPSKEYDLECLASELVESTDFKMLFRYIFPLPRLLSLMAIYSSKGFLASVGENTKDPPGGVELTFPTNWSEIAGDETDAQAWRSYEEREHSGIDSWDRGDLFKKSKKQARKLFQLYWNSRDFTYQDDSDPKTDFLNSLKGLFGGWDPSGWIPWWKFPSVRNRPFNMHGDECPGFLDTMISDLEKEGYTAEEITEYPFEVSLSEQQGSTWDVATDKDGFIIDKK